MVAYEFYAKNGSKEADLIGILPERRRHSTRITRKSIMKWGRLIAGGYVDQRSIYFVRIET